MILPSLHKILGVILPAQHKGLTASLSFCLQEVVHYFCDLAPLMRLACVDPRWHARVIITIIGIIITCNLVLIFSFYRGILRAVLKLPSAASRAKAFSTCSSHIMVVALFYGSAFIVYVGRKGSRTQEGDKLLALVYTCLTPGSQPSRWLICLYRKTHGTCQSSDGLGVSDLGIDSRVQKSRWEKQRRSSHVTN